ncbi:hypothetical protein L1887_43270 [Cichorium endivia]|nr:hypothetical protein L1887_43270 [Cichorium endivia]
MSWTAKDGEGGGVDMKLQISGTDEKRGKVGKSTVRFSEEVIGICSMNDDVIMSEEVKDPRSIEKQANVFDTYSIKNQWKFSNECERIDNSLLNSNEKKAFV